MHTQQLPSGLGAMLNALEGDSQRALAARGAYPQYRAPATDNSTLIEPPLAGTSVRPAARDNLGIALGDRSLAELAQAARHELYEAAIAYTATYRTLPDDYHCKTCRGSRPLLLTGHQAEIFHSGVWFKNFVASRLAEESGGVAVHLVIDTDLCRHTSLRVPTGSVDNPRLEAIPFDLPRTQVPYEERAIEDWDLFNSFGRRVTEAISNLVPHPLVEQWWPLVIERGRASGKIGLAIAQGRHQLEESWGLATLELPQSHVCQLPSYHWFVAHLLHDIESFRRAYNGALGRYREAHGLGNPAQPLPDLTEEDGWQETPFWVWTPDDPSRRPLFARREGDHIELTDRAGWQSTLAADFNGDYRRAAEQLDGLAGTGLRLRTRALATTLFSRLLVADLFLHGIGGAKYDQVTDDLAHRWLGVELPPFSALSATLRLPITHPRTASVDVANLRQELRGLTYHPERYLPSPIPSEAQRWVDQKEWGVQSTKTPANAAERHRQITEANAALQRWVAPRRQHLELVEPDVVHQTRVTALLESREYAFCLFPEENLRERLWRLAGS